MFEEPCNILGSHTSDCEGTIIWDVTLCSLIGGCRHFGGPAAFPASGRSAEVWITDKLN
jgi:hypothetical protein